MGRIRKAAFAAGGGSSKATFPFRLHVGECQAIASHPHGELLSQGRKFGHEMVLAHEHVVQVPEEACAAIDVGTSIALRAGPRDTTTLAPLFDEPLRPGDLSSLPCHEAYLRTSSPEGTDRCSVKLANFVTRDRAPTRGDFVGAPDSGKAGLAPPPTPTSCARKESRSGERY